MESKAAQMRTFFKTKMHRNAFGGRNLPGPAGGAPPDPLDVFDGRGGAPGKGRRMGRGNGRGKRKGKGKWGSNYYDDLAQ